MQGLATGVSLPCGELCRSEPDFATRMVAPGYAGREEGRNGFEIGRKWPLESRKGPETGLQRREAALDGWGRRVRHPAVVGLDPHPAAAVGAGHHDDPGDERTADRESAGCPPPGADGPDRAGRGGGAPPSPPAHAPETGRKYTNVVPSCRHPIFQVTVLSTGTDPRHTVLAKSGEDCRSYSPRRHGGTGTGRSPAGSCLCQDRRS